MSTWHPRKGDRVQVPTEPGPREVLGVRGTRVRYREADGTERVCTLDHWRFVTGKAATPNGDLR